MPADGTDGWRPERPERAQASDALFRSVTSEAIGAGLMSFLIVAAGLLGERFAIDNIAIASLATALTGAASFAVLARVLAPAAVSYFNPGVALAFILSGRIDFVTGLCCAAAQIAAAFLGVMIAHIVTNTGLVQVATQIQSGEGVWAGEFLGTALFVFALLSVSAQSPDRLPLTGAFCLLAAALATPSTSFANPALTLARTLTDSFTAIRLNDAVTIAGIQLLAALAAFALYRWMKAGA
ncbi:MULTISPECIES: aquaporin [Rhodomicrobium]|uniref:aquaporin n=1 Tax=Rhodomicrobium TaxID=1068 RepID=UPI0014825386|nr:MULTISPECIES: aquaporin [Rhodomicrobium]